VTIEELLRGLIVASADDAARTLAETIADTEADFAGLMNKEAQRLGMRDTHFVMPPACPTHCITAALTIWRCWLRLLSTTSRNTFRFMPYVNMNITTSNITTATVCCGWIPM